MSVDQLQIALLIVIHELNNQIISKLTNVSEGLEDKFEIQILAGILFSE